MYRYQHEVLIVDVVMLRTSLSLHTFVFKVILNLQKLSLSHRLKTGRTTQNLSKVFKRKLTEFCKQRTNSHLQVLKLIVQLLH